MNGADSQYKIARAKSSDVNQFDNIDLDDIFSADYLFPDERQLQTQLHFQNQMLQNQMQMMSRMQAGQLGVMGGSAGYPPQMMQPNFNSFPGQGNPMGNYYGNMNPGIGMGMGGMMNQGTGSMDNNQYADVMQQQQQQQQQSQQQYIQPGSKIMIPPIPPSDPSKGFKENSKMFRKEKKTGANLLPKKITKAQQKKLEKEQLKQQNAENGIITNKTTKSSSKALKSGKKDEDDDDFDDDDDDSFVSDEHDDEHDDKRRKSGAGEDDDDDEEEEGGGDENSRVERRERNREHAKRSRVRKRLLLGTLQDRLTVLRSENVKLRRVILDKIPHMAAVIFNECTTEESNLLSKDDNVVNLGNSVHSSSSSQKVSSSSSNNKNKKNDLGLEDVVMSSSTAAMYNAVHNPNSVLGMSSGTADKQRESRILMEPDFRLIQALQKSQHNFVLSDPSLPDNPIVYCSDGFCKLTGYKRQHILGRNCRFLQGPGTDSNAVDIIRQGVAVGADISVCLLNYKADGTPFWNQFFVAALRDSDGCIVNFVGVQCEVNSIPISALKDRVKKIKIPD